MQDRPSSPHRSPNATPAWVIEILEKGCPLDLRPRAFGPGHAVSTTVGPIAVLLWQTDDTPTYRLLPRSSFADCLARWLMDAMSEYGGPRVA